MSCSAFRRRSWYSAYAGAAVSASAQAAIRLYGIPVAVNELRAHLRPFLLLHWGKQLLTINSVAWPDGREPRLAVTVSGFAAWAPTAGFPGYPTYFPVKGTTGFIRAGRPVSRAARCIFRRGHGRRHRPVASLSAVPGRRVSGRERWAGMPCRGRGDWRPGTFMRRCLFRGCLAAGGWG